MVGTASLTFGVNVQFCSEAEGTSCDVGGYSKQQVPCQGSDRFLGFFAKHQFVAQWQDASEDHLEKRGGFFSADAGQIRTMGEGSVAVHPGGGWTLDVNFPTDLLAGPRGFSQRITAAGFRTNMFSSSSEQVTSPVPQVLWDVHHAIINGKRAR